MTSSIIAALREGRYKLICIADIPPSPSPRSRYLVKRLRAIAPRVPILVGRWAPPELADDDTQSLLTAGAVAVSTTLAECGEQMVRAVAAAHDASAASVSAA